MFITFEGIDGIGKSTQAKKLATFFKEHNESVIETQEPPKGEFYNEIKKYLLNNNLEAETELLLFTAMRKEHVEKVIKPALSQKRIVICDRFIDSTFAYQICGKKSLRGKFFYYLNRKIKVNLKPDHTFILDGSIEKSLERIKHKDKFEQMPFGYFQIVKDTFLELANTSDRYHVIENATEKSIEAIHKEIVDILF